jgi:hypothetical protein
LGSVGHYLAKNSVCRIFLDDLQREEKLQEEDKELQREELQ